jgi:RNA polymerase sigma-70 factor (ECF subfamily)
MSKRGVAARSANPLADAAMDRYAGGDASAFAPLYDALAPRLHAFLLRQTRDRALAADVLQQTMIQMHEARASFVPGSPVTPWCFAIARRILIDSARRAGREVPCAVDVARRADVPSRALAPDEELELRQLACHVAGEFERLPHRQRAACELVMCRGLTLAEAAQALGTSVGAVKLRLHRAYAAIHAAIRGGADARRGRPA